ncbi:MAG: FkbM family methyltransferase [Pseudomonadota bacterium]
MDSLRLQGRAYHVRLKDGVIFEMVPGQGDWFTLLEGYLRRDYLRHGVRIAPGDTVLDIGANFGAFTVLASRMVGKSGQIHAFEPNPETHKRLLRNLEINQCTNVIVHNEAIGTGDGQMPFYLADRSAYASAQPSVNANSFDTAEIIQVASRNINTFFNTVEGAIALMKVDCEGGEYDLFQELTASNAHRILQVAMELHRIPGREMSEVHDALVQTGFSVVGSRPMVALRD